MIELDHERLDVHKVEISPLPSTKRIPLPVPLPLPEREQVHLLFKKGRNLLTSGFPLSAVALAKADAPSRETAIMAKAEGA